jgi:RAQPRD family integrative conjugative element protein
MNARRRYVITPQHLAVSCPPWLLGIAAAAGLSLCHPSAADADLENAQLAALVRQLDLLDRIAEQSASAPTPASGTRYHFDYARLRNDVKRIRTGIEEYLRPRRAQPRDPYVLSGEYQRDSAPTP